MPGPVYLPAQGWEQLYYIALFLEGFLFGLYSGIFAIYLQYQTSKKDTNKTQNILFYSMCALYVLSASVFSCDIATVVIYYSINIPAIQTTLFTCCDFIAQFILIYRCWIVWGRNIRIVIIPSILVLAFLVMWTLSTLGGGSTLSGPSVHGSNHVAWPSLMTPAGLALSLTVNALMMGLIVFRIFKVFRAVKATSGDQILGATGGSKLRCTILVLIESAMALFSIQLARLVASFYQRGDDPDTFYPSIFIVVIHQMLNGITPTIILVRTSMGLSFHDEKSMEEVAIGSLRFASNHPNSVQDTSIVGEDITDDDDIGVRRSKVVER